MRTLLCIFAFLGLLLPAAYAAVPQDVPPEVKAVEAYLNGISTLKTDFVQTDNQGKQMAGVFLLKRPGRMRFDYQPPVTDFIVSDGLLVHYYDGQMKQESSMPIGRSLADFFLRKNLRLSGDISVSDVRRENGLLQMTLTQTRNPLAGSLTLILSEKPLQLKKWRVVDAQGLVTKIDLLNTQAGIKLSNSLFHYYDPARKESFLNK